MKFSSHNGQKFSRETLIDPQPFSNVSFGDTIATPFGVSRIIWMDSYDNII